MNVTESLKARVIGNGRGNKHGEHARRGSGCPFLYYEDCMLQDISNLEDDRYLYGGPGSKHYARLDGYNKIKVVHTTNAGSLSEIMLEVGGNGPGELFLCHWNLFLCLPESEQASFEKMGLGLFGSPDGNSQNDWTNTDGTVLDLPHTKGLKNKEAYDYCTNK